MQITDVITPVKPPKVFCDNDGVLADFQMHLFELFGIHPGSVPDDDMWAMVLATPDFWPTIPVKYGAHDLWALLKPHNPVVLTGCPKNHYEVAAAQKVKWVKHHFGADVEVITCLSRNKPRYMESPGDILIDDMRGNTRNWVKAGGVAVQYRTVRQAMTDFKVAIAKYEV